MSKITGVKVTGTVTFDIALRREIPIGMVGGPEQMANWLDEEIQKAIRDEAESKIDWSKVNVQFLTEVFVRPGGNG